MVLKLHAHIMRVLFEHGGMEHIPHLRTAPSLPKITRSRETFGGRWARGGRWWITHQGIHQGERTSPDWQEKKRWHCLGPHGDEVPVEGRCCTGSHRLMTRSHTLTYAGRWAQDHTERMVLEGYSTRALQACNIIYAVENTVPFK